MQTLMQGNLPTSARAQADGRVAAVTTAWARVSVGNPPCIRGLHGMLLEQPGLLIQG
jgi:hypothetical protein